MDVKLQSCPYWIINWEEHREICTENKVNAEMRSGAFAPQKQNSTRLALKEKCGRSELTFLPYTLRSSED